MFFSFRSCSAWGTAFLCCGLLTWPASASVITGMNAYWNFNESSGTTAANAGSAGSTLNGTLLEQAFFAPGLFGNAVSLPGRPAGYTEGDPTSYVNVNNEVIADGAGAYTVSLWFNTPESSGRRQVLFESGPNYALSGGLASNGRVEHYVQAGTSDNAVTNFTPTLNQWHHLAITYAHDPGSNQGTNKIYIDGMEYADAELVTTGVLASTTYFRIGQHRYPYGEYQSFNGLIDDMAIWNRTLGASEAAVIAGLGSVSGIDLGNSTEIDNVLAMNTLGQSTTAGSDTWYYTNAVAAPNTGGSPRVGRNYVGADGHHYIVTGGNAIDGFTGVATPRTARWVGYYPMQTDGGAPVGVGNQATTVDDASAPVWAPALGAYHGTPSGGESLQYSADVPATILGLDGLPTTRSLSFDGANDSVELGISQELRDLPQDAFTVEAWIKTTDSNRGNLLGTYYSGVPRGFNFEILGGGNLRAYMQGLTSGGANMTFDFAGIGKVNNGEWRHVAMVYTGPGTNNVQLYIDGQLDRQGTYTGAGFSIDPSTPLRIGNDNRASGPIQYAGLMDQVRIASEALVPGQFLIAGRGEQNYYRMETAGGAGPAATIADTGLHPFTYDGTALGTGGSTPAYSTTVPDRLIVRDGVELENRHSLSFNGVSDYVDLGDKTLLKTLPQDDFTIEFFMKKPAQNRQIIVGTHTGSTFGAINLETVAATGALRTYVNSGTVINDMYGTVNICDDEWHHLALVRSGAGTDDDLMTLYVDYEMDVSRALTVGQFTIDADFFRLGRDNRDTLNYQGLLDEFRITRGALDVGQFLTAVPEPGSLGLLLTGLLGPLCLRRRCLWSARTGGVGRTAVRTLR